MLVSFYTRGPEDPTKTSEEEFQLVFLKTNGIFFIMQLLHITIVKS